MTRKIIMAGRLKSVEKKPSNMQYIIEKINMLDINKNQKYILFIAAIRIIELKKENKRLIMQLEQMMSEKKILNNFKSSKYVTNIVKYLNDLESNLYNKDIKNLLDFVKINNIEI